MATKQLYIVSIAIFIVLGFASSELDEEITGVGVGVGVVNETLERRLHLEPETIEEEDDEDADGLPRRSLYWKSPGPRRFYISYGSLSANRIPCPARSGRSYYTHNCFGASGRANPYTRSCTAVARCRR